MTLFFSSKRTVMSNESSFQFYFRKSPKNADLRVWVHPNHYNKSVDAINDLAAALPTKIPFKFEIVTSPEVRILGGHRVRGIVSVEMLIRFDLIIAEAVRQLEAAGFHEGTEEYLG